MHLAINHLQYHFLFYLMLAEDECYSDMAMSYTPHIQQCSHLETACSTPIDCFMSHNPHGVGSVTLTHLY